jgi:hypothetical protein
MKIRENYSVLLQFDYKIVTNGEFMFFSKFLPKNDIFFNLFDQPAEFIVKTAEGLKDLVNKNRNFRSVAVEELESLRGVHRELRSKQTINDYIFVLEKYLIPFFGRYPFREINQQLIDDFDSWRISEMGLI